MDLSFSLDASPDDSSPPVEGSGGAISVKPEFVFDEMSSAHHRFLGGLRLRFAAVNVSFETVYSEEVQSYGMKLGLDF